MKSSYAGKPCIHILFPRCKALERKKHEKYSQDRNTEIHSWKCVPQSQWKGKKAIMLRVQCCPKVFNMLSFCLYYIYYKQKDSMLNTFVITAVTKSSMKLRSGATANHHLYNIICSIGERNGEQR